VTPFQAVVLALVQAVTEFLPVSSSGHLILLPRLLGWTDQGLEFDIATNTGTLLATLLYFRRDVADLLRGVVASFRPAGGGACRLDARTAYAILWGTVPAGLAGLAAKDWIATVARNPLVIAATAIVFGSLLWIADRRGSGERELAAVGVRDGLLIGCAQALALVPGTSRSGITITAALFLGLSRGAAARFSFLLAIPIGVLVGAKQLVDVLRGRDLGVPGEAIAIGIAVSAVAGYAVIAGLLAWLRGHRLTVFAVYRILLGLLLLAVFAR
jgi:undecaprenyl-diphosphatase